MYSLPHRFVANQSILATYLSSNKCIHCHIDLWPIREYLPLIYVAKRFSFATYRLMATQSRLATYFSSNKCIHCHIGLWPLKIHCRDYDCTDFDTNLLNPDYQIHDDSEQSRQLYDWWMFQDVLECRPDKNCPTPLLTQLTWRCATLQAIKATFSTSVFGQR